MRNDKQSDIIIAYVEDEPAIAQLLVSGLGLSGIDVHPVFMSAEELLEQMDSATFDEIDIFFFDIRLPRMSGLELAAELRARGETRPFVLISAWPPPPAHSLAEVEAEFLPKPFDFPDIVRTIHRLSQN